MPRQGSGAPAVPPLPPAGSRHGCGAPAVPPLPPLPPMACERQGWGVPPLPPTEASPLSLLDSPPQSAVETTRPALASAAATKRARRARMAFLASSSLMRSSLHDLGASREDLDLGGLGLGEVFAGLADQLDLLVALEVPARGGSAGVLRIRALRDRLRL